MEVMKVMVTSFKRSHAGTVTLSAPIPEVGHRRPRPLRRLLDAHRQLWVSLLQGHSSFLLGPGVYKLLFVPSKSLFLQSCVRSGDSMVGLMATSSKRSHPGLLHLKPLPLQQSIADPYLCRRHSNMVLSQSLWGLWVLVHTKFV